jgi:hypothetical protein
MFIASINQHDEGGTRSRRPHLMDGAPPEGGDAKGIEPPQSVRSSTMYGWPSLSDIDSKGEIKHVYSPRGLGRKP